MATIQLPNKQFVEQYKEEFEQIPKIEITSEENASDKIVLYVSADNITLQDSHDYTTDAVTIGQLAQQFSKKFKDGWRRVGTGRAVKVNILNVESTYEASARPTVHITAIGVQHNEGGRTLQQDINDIRKMSYPLAEESDTQSDKEGASFTAITAKTPPLFKVSCPSLFGDGVGLERMVIKDISINMMSPWTKGGMSYGEIELTLESLTPYVKQPENSFFWGLFG